MKTYIQLRITSGGAEWMGGGGGGGRSISRRPNEKKFFNMYMSSWHIMHRQD